MLFHAFIVSVFHYQDLDSDILTNLQFGTTRFANNTFRKFKAASKFLVLQFSNE